MTVHLSEHLGCVHVPLAVYLQQYTNGMLLGQFSYVSVPKAQYVL